ncbi:MAG: lytic transglycosylase domain-containing protein, partial [Elusimicrobiota bacterium]
IIAAESEFSKGAISPRNARGLMQILPETAAELGFSKGQLHDPAANIHAGTAYLAELYRIAWKKYRLKGVGYRDAPLWVIQRIIASYNAGPRAMGRNSWMRQTRNYVRKVLLFYRSDVSEFRGDLSRSAQKSSPVLPLHSYGTLH